MITPNVGLPVAATDRTVLFWAKDNNTSADGHDHAATEYGSPGRLTNGFGTFVFAAGDTNSPVGGMAISPWGGGTGTTTAFDDGQWHFFAVTTSGGGTPTYKVYADGVLQNSTTITTNTILGLANAISPPIQRIQATRFLRLHQNATRSYLRQLLAVTRTVNGRPLQAKWHFMRRFTIQTDE